VPRSRTDRIGDDVLNTALAACALLYWGSSTPALECAIHLLLTEQRRDGSWPRAALYYSGPKKLYAWGSEELITGFCLEALLRYRILVPLVKRIHKLSGILTRQEQDGRRPVVA